MTDATDASITYARGREACHNGFAPTFGSKNVDAWYESQYVWLIGLAVLGAAGYGFHKVILRGKK